MRLICFAHRPNNQIVRFLGLALTTILSLAACSDDSYRTYGPIGPPTVLGKWEGTVVFIQRPDTSASIVTGPKETYFEISDSTFTYTHYHSDKYVDPRYGGTASYALTATTIKFDQTPAAPAADYRLIPYSNYPHSYILTHEKLIITRIEKYGPTAETEQRVELSRPH